MSSLVRGFEKLGLAADGRAVKTVREWVDKGCPVTREGDVHVFDVDKVRSWCNERGLDFDDKSKKELTELQQQKLRQETYKADEMKRKDLIASGEYSSVEEFESTIIRVLTDVRRLMVETVTEIKDEAGLTGKAAEKIDAMLIDGFNRIADLGKDADED